MWFEAANQYFKQITRRIQNFKKITSTLVKRHKTKKCFEQLANVLLLSSCLTLYAQKQLSIKQLPADPVQLLIAQSGFMIGVTKIDAVLAASTPSSECATRLSFGHTRQPFAASRSADLKEPH